MILAASLKSKKKKIHTVMRQLTMTMIYIERTLSNNYSTFLRHHSLPRGVTSLRQMVSMGNLERIRCSRGVNQGRRRGPVVFDQLFGYALMLRGRILCNFALLCVYFVLDLRE